MLFKTPETHGHWRNPLLSSNNNSHIALLLSFSQPQPPTYFRPSPPQLYLLGSLTSTPNPLTRCSCSEAKEQLAQLLPQPDHLHPPLSFPLAPCPQSGKVELSWSLFLRLRLPMLHLCQLNSSSSGVLRKQLKRLQGPLLLGLKLQSLLQLSLVGFLRLQHLQ